jgi:glycine cleavage system H lipoate-binding protein
MKFIWVRENADKTVSIGFTRDFIDQQLSECFHVVLVNDKTTTKGKSMLTIETNDGLKTIKAPVTGAITFFDSNARDFPDRCNWEQEVIKIFPKESVVVSTSAQGVKKNPLPAWDLPDDLFNFVNRATGPTPPPPDRLP